MLTNSELNNLPYSNVSITDYTFFPQNQVLEINHQFYIVLGDQHFPTGIYNQQIRFYTKANHWYLYDLQSGICVRIIAADIIKTHVENFDGFSKGKQFQLQNGQIWQQTNVLNSPCQPGGKVWIKDKCVMRVGNWDFNVEVIRLS